MPCTGLFVALCACLLSVLVGASAFDGVHTRFCDVMGGCNVMSMGWESADATAPFFLEQGAIGLQYFVPRQGLH